MIKKIFFFSCLLFFIAPTAFCQGDFLNHDFKKTDSIAISVKLHHENYFVLARDLTAPFNNDTDKVRSIFRWIADNIAYDYKTFNKQEGDPVFECKNNNNCGSEEIAYNTQLIHQILKKKKAVSNGYALLFKTLCTIAGIKSDVVTGYVKTEAYQIGTSLPADHAWNIVKIDSEWYCLDVTWAAGHDSTDEESDDVVGWTKHFTPFFFCTPYEKFIRDHFQEYADELKFMDSKNTKQDFFNFPFFYSVEALNNIEQLKPFTGMLNAKLGDTLVFSIKYKKPFNHFQLNSNIQQSPSIYTQTGKGKNKIVTIDPYLMTRQVYYPFERKGDLIIIKYIITSSSIYYIDLLFDFKPAVRYRLSVPWSSDNN
jgi:transglutaminase superfamily protein